MELGFDPSAVDAIRGKRGALGILLPRPLIIDSRPDHQRGTHFELKHGSNLVQLVRLDQCTFERAGRKPPEWLHVVSLGRWPSISRESEIWIRWNGRSYRLGLVSEAEVVGGELYLGPIAYLPVDANTNARIVADMRTYQR